MKIRSASIGIAMAAMASVAPMAAHAELVTNGGFETGDFSGWNLGQNTGHTGIDNTAASGSFAAYFGAVGSPTILSQQLNTVAGTLYTISFDLMSDGGQPTTWFNANFAYQDLVNLVNAPGFGYTHYSFDVAAVQAQTILNFNIQQDPAYFHLDNVSVVQSVAGAVPEPSTWAMLIVGFGMMGMALRRRRALAAI